jgi:molybdenum cofactor synthesis domain-containing protein
LKPFGKLLPFEEALKLVLDTVKPLEDTEQVFLDNAVGRVLAADIKATHSTPPCDRAAMDGYAVIADDTYGASRRNPRICRQIFTVYAGQAETKEISTGQCIQIATGAKMPPTADAVVIVEETEKDGDDVKIFKPSYPGANISREGEDIRKGESVLKRGSLLDPGKIGVLASQGLTEVTVLRMPRVAVLPTGEEVATAGTALREGQVYDINSHTIAALVLSNGGQAVPLDIAGDTPQQLKASLSKALDSDLVVISGGSSVGERDLLFDILEEMGEVLFHGIQIKPGKPTLFAVIKDKPVLGMPGYPTSCLINAYLLLQPALRKMAGLPPKRTQVIEARLGANVLGTVGRRQFLTVKMEGFTAMPIFKESGAITGTAQADGYIELAPNIDVLNKDEVVSVTLF